MPISPAQAALGTSIVITALEGEEKVEVPPGTQTGARFRVGGRGMPRVGRHGRGDLYVIVEIQTPKRMGKEEKKIYQELLRLEKEREEKGSGFFRKILSARVELRAFPKLRFHWDPTPENADHIEKVLAGLREKKK